MGRDVSRGPGVSSHVELRLAGTFGVVRDGTELSAGELGSRKSRTLLKVLAVERAGPVAVDRIVEVLWAHEPPAAAEQNVASLVSRLRGVLGPGVILGGRQGYRLARSPAVSVDLDTAARYCEQAERKLASSPAIALAAAEHAIGLLAGDVALADEPYSPWADRARDELRGLLRHGGVVMIVGEAGIGKTALAGDLAAEVADNAATVLQTRCYEAERSLFLQPVVEALAPAAARLTASTLQQLLGEHWPAAAALLPEVAALLGPLPSSRGSPEMERRRSFEAMTAFLAGLAERAPVLLAVDDLQYAGQSTTEFIHYLGRHMPGSRVLVVATVRADHDQQTGAALASVATRVEVGPLGAAAVERLAREAGQSALAGSILQRTGGHTLFVVEVLRALANGDAGLPESLRSAVQARVRQSGPATETLLRAASVLGVAIDPLTLGELLQIAPAAAVERCEEALRARLLVVSGRDYEFANDLIREVIYATTPEPTRLAYHRRAADLLTGQPEALARHAGAAEDWPRAARAWLLAARDAMRRYGASDAITLSTGPRCRRARRRCQDACLSLARAWLGRGNPERARAILAPLLTVAERVPWTATLAATLAVDARALLATGEHDQARAHLLRAEQLARQHGLPHVLREARSTQRTLR